LVHDVSSGAGGAAFASSGHARRVGRFSRAGLAIEKPNLAGDDFRPVAFAAAVLRLVLAGREPFFDVDLTAFADEPDNHAAV